MLNTRSIPFVSVIIPVYNDPIRLQTCLQVLEKQTYPKNSFEVIVIDNGSEQSIEPIVSQFPQARASFEAQRSSYAARNKGITMAQGEILAFTDSDCIPASDWVAKGVAHLQHRGDSGIIGGSVEFFFHDPRRPTAAELYNSLTDLQMKFHIEQMGFCATCNLFAFKRTFEHIGPFDGNLKSGGDLEWSHRATASGYTLWYAEEVRIAHPARNSFAELIRKERRVAEGRIMLGAHWKNDPLPFKWNYTSVIAHLPVLPPIFKIVRLPQASLLTKIRLMISTSILFPVLWGVTKYVRLTKQWRLKLRDHP